MKVGFQTISWGRRLDDNGEKMLQVISKAGYEGVELMQHPNEFGSAKQLYSHLKRLNLKLLGLTGGSIKERVDFIEELKDIESRDLACEGEPLERVIRFSRDYPYICIDTWDQRQVRLVGPELTLALRPHMFKPVQTAQEAEKLLSDYSHLRFLPDTAHLTIAGANLLKLLEDNLARIIAVHLKDWASEFGQSYQFYSRGFGVQFGDGDVKLSESIEFLKSKRYNKWVVVEQDVADDPVEAAQQCRNWLRINHNI